MSTNTLAGAIVGFLLGGLTVSVAAQVEETERPADQGQHAPRH